MANIPNEIISKPRKFAHEAFGFLAALAFFAAAGNFFTSNIGAAIFSGLAAMVFGHISSKIKFRWVLRGGVGIYE